MKRIQGWHRRRSAQALVLVALVWMLCPQTASAYIDPGSGSAGYQMLLAGVLGVGFTFRRLIVVMRSKFR